MRVLSPVAALAALASSVAPVPAAVAGGAVNPYNGVPRCRVVAHADIHGTGTPNAVGLQRRGRAGTDSAAVVVRVEVGDRAVTLRRPTLYWSGRVPLWQGAADVDGRRGKALFVGRTYGAHSVAIGWQRRVDDPRGLVRYREAFRQGQSDSFNGVVMTFRWRKDGWVRTDLRRYR